MRLLILALQLLPGLLAATPDATPADDIKTALTGNWVGTLEYRDFSEPATSAKRVKLPTWLTIEPFGADLTFHYVYDDGPTKTVTETSTIKISPEATQYTEKGEKSESIYTVAGADKLKQGRGTLTLTGKGTDNNKPVAVRVTLKVGRNIIEELRETAESGQPYVFRHNFVFTRSTYPK